MKPQGEVTNAEFRDAIRILGQVVDNQAGKQRGNQHDVVDTCRIHEFFRMNPTYFTGSSSTKDPKNFLEDLRKIMEVIHVIDVERVRLVAYQLKGVSRIVFDQWKSHRGMFLCTYVMNDFEGSPRGMLLCNYVMNGFKRSPRGTFLCTYVMNEMLNVDLI